MAKKVFLTEKPSVAQEFAKVLMTNEKRGNGYIEDDNYIITWCVGHLVAMSYPEAYDPSLKLWRYDTLPFVPDTYRYEIIGSVSQQFKVVKSIFTRKDVDTIYFAGDSGREGEYIGRLVLDMCGKAAQSKKLLRVWIDSQTEDEIKKGIRNAKPLSAYDNMAAAAYCRAKEDYLMGINFSRVLTLKYGRCVAGVLGQDKLTISVGRVMTCVLALVVERELAIKNFVKKSFYKVAANVEQNGESIVFDWKAVEGSRYYGTHMLYKENGFVEKKDADALIAGLPSNLTVTSVERIKEKKSAPLLFNLAELQSECSKAYKISPDETLSVVQELYEKKLVTYPRTDARVLTTAVAKEISKNITGLTGYTPLSKISQYLIDNHLYSGIGRTKYTDDSKVTDHYAIIPTGQGLSALSGLSAIASNVYDMIARRFVAIFLPPAEYQKIQINTFADKEFFGLSVKVLANKGYLGIYPEASKKDNTQLFNILNKIAKGQSLTVRAYTIIEGETKPPKRYDSGSMILAMENAGNLIEDENLRAQIKSCGIGTSATRAETLKKLVKIGYISLNTKTQILTPTKVGYAVYGTVKCSIPQMLSPKLTASWEKGLNGIADGSITEQEYMDKMKSFVVGKTNVVKVIKNEQNTISYIKSL